MTRVVIGLFFLEFVLFGEPWVDYQKFDHDVIIKKIRGGIHDESGENQYFFSVKMIGLIDDSNEKSKIFAERKKIEEDLGSFCQMSLAALKIWENKEEKGKENACKVSLKGERMRMLAAKMMQSYGVKEKEVLIQIRVESWVKKKKYMFLNNDVKLGEILYNPMEEQTEKQISGLKIEDNLSLEVSVDLLYP